MLSIIIPIFNSEKTLQECLKSLEIQEYKNFEVLLVDNNSTDTSVSICLDLVERDSRFRLIQEKKQGSAYARNRGLREAKGEYVTFVDSDDYVRQDAYAILMPKLIKTGADAVVFSFNYVDENGSQLPWYSPQLKKYNQSIFSGKDIADIFLKSRDIEGFGWNKVFKRKLFFENEILFDVKKRAYEDMCTVFEVLACCERVNLESAKLYYYRQVGSSLTHEGYREKEHEYISSVNAIYGKAMRMGLKNGADIFRMSRCILYDYDKYRYQKAISCSYNYSLLKLFVLLIRFRSEKAKIFIKGIILWYSDKKYLYRKRMK